MTAEQAGNYLDQIVKSLTSNLIRLAVALWATAATASDYNSMPAWFWRMQCGDQGLAIEVILGRASVYHVEVPICHMDRTPEATAEENDGYKVRFATSGPLTFSGYRDTDDVVPAGKSLEMEIWEAGADPDDLLIGVSVVGDKTIYMNTVIIADPNVETSSSIADG